MCIQYAKIIKTKVEFDLIFHLTIFVSYIFNKLGISMPTYDYKCLECDYQFELFQKITETPITECPKCKGKVKRLIGMGVSPIFKGNGFYQTDYKNNSKKSEKKTDSGKE